MANSDAGVASADAGADASGKHWAERPWLWAAIAVALVCCWQAATVHVNYADHVSGLFRIGKNSALPTSLKANSFRNSHPKGYDGQFYRLLAHDPFLRSGTAAFIDAPMLRSRRILVPMLAWMVALGRDDLVDGAYVLVVAAFLFGGVYWLSSLALLEGRRAALGLGFLLVPAALIAVDSMTVDVALAALTALFAWQVRTGRDRALWVTLAAAGLVRETGLLLVVAAVLAAAFQRNFRKSVILATAAIPALCWYGYLISVLPPAATSLHAGFPMWVIPRPRLGILERAIDPPHYRGLAPALKLLLSGLDRLALVATMGVILLGILRVRRTRPTALKFALAVHLLFLLSMTGKYFWNSPYGYSRPLAPLFVLILVGDGAGAACCGIAAIALCACVDLRVLTEFGFQALNVFRWLTGG